MSLARFAEKYKVLYQKWGYRYPGGNHSAYEDKTHQGLNEFQRLTDYFMRFLEQDGFASSSDVRRMFIDYNFYVEGGAFNMTDTVLGTYLKECGPYFKANRTTCKKAYKYLLRCPPSSTRCFLQVSLQWMKVIRKYYMRYEKKKEIRIRSFKRLLKATAIAECQEYVQKEYGGTLDVNTVKDAITQVEEYDGSSSTSDDTDTTIQKAMSQFEEYDVDTSSGTSDYTSEEEVNDLSLQLRL